MKDIDITILTDRRYLNPSKINDYIQNVLTEDQLLFEAFERQGLTAFRTNWDNPEFNWASTRYVIFRTTWDYFDRYEEFITWLDEVENVTTLINPKKLIHWNVDKHYLQDLEKAQIAIPPTLFIESGDNRSLKELAELFPWHSYVLKPAISGAARHTYVINKGLEEKLETVYRELIANESMLLQEFQDSIQFDGEVSLMVFGGKYSHAILKKAKPGDFRVQDDFGGSVHPYHASQEEIDFALKAVAACTPQPLYARVDIFRDNEGNLALGELELIEPELWFRMNKDAADICAKAVTDFINHDLS